MTEEQKLNLEDIDDKCEECKKIDESVRENLILTGFKIYIPNLTYRTYW